MDSLLRLSKYLPAEFQEERKLVDVLELILSTRLLIDGIGTPQRKEPISSLPQEPPTLPLDRQRELIFNSHPYYANSFCLTSKTLLPVCEQNKYKIFQMWCFPSMSVTDLERLLPRLTWDDVIKIALLYHPIPESLSYWDSVNLAYYALRNNQEDMDVYLEPAFKTTDHFLVSLMCYKFNELDTLRKFALGNENIYDYGVYMILNYKLNGNIEPYPESMKVKMSSVSFQIDLMRFIDSIIPYVTNTLFSYKDMIEFLIIHDIVFPNDRGTNPYYTIVNGVYFDFIGQSDIFIMYCVQSYGFDNTDALLISYGKQDKVKRAAYNGFTLNRFRKPAIINYRMRTDSKLMEQDIPEQYRWVYYLTSGDIIKYLSSKPLSYNNQGSSASRYYGWNESGAKLINEFLEHNINRV